MAHTSGDEMVGSDGNTAAIMVECVVFAKNVVARRYASIIVSGANVKNVAGFQYAPMAVSGANAENVGGLRFALTGVREVPANNARLDDR